MSRPKKGLQFLYVKRRHSHSAIPFRSKLYNNFLVLTSYYTIYSIMHHESVLYFSLSAKVVIFPQSAKF